MQVRIVQTKHGWEYTVGNVVGVKPTKVQAWKRGVQVQKELAS